MFARTVTVEAINAMSEARPIPLAHIDSFAMRNFTNDAIFDDTLPVADGLMEAGLRVPVDLLHDRMEDWLRRKGYLGKDEKLRVSEVSE